MLRAKNNSLDFLFKALSWASSLSLSLSLSCTLQHKNKPKKEKENLGYLVCVDSITFWISNLFYFFSERIMPDNLPKVSVSLLTEEEESMWETLLPEILTLVLIRLPIKSIQTCTYVSTKWISLIREDRDPNSFPLISSTPTPTPIPSYSSSSALRDSWKQTTTSEEGTPMKKKHSRWIGTTKKNTLGFPCWWFITQICWPIHSQEPLS